MTSIIMIIHNRYQLTEQAIKSLYQHTPREDFTLCLVDDASDDFRVTKRLHEISINSNCTYIRIEKSCHVLSQARNIGAYWSEQTFGRGDYICFLDNDVYVFDGWLNSLIAANEGGWNFHIIGGYQHPFHATKSSHGSVHEVDAVAGYSMFMELDVWDKYGPFRSSASGIGQSEDFEICQRISKDGWMVGYIHPPVLSHCGITNSYGKPATGADQFERVPGVLYL